VKNAVLPTKPAALEKWVLAVAAHTRPSRIHWCDGTEGEIRGLEERMVGDGTMIRLQPDRFPRCYLHRSDPSDVSRTEQSTFICCADPSDAGPTNNWMSHKDAERKVWPLFSGCMHNRTMYVVPYLMGPVGSRYSRVGVQVTDSPYVVANLRIMTRMGRVALEQLGEATDFVRGVHSLGDLSPDRRYIVHFPSIGAIWSIGSGYGGNALLSKKCHALRVASAQARQEGWLAEHMLIVGLTPPQGAKHYIAAAFPSACGKTNLAMLVSSLPGWTVETVGDDIAWMHVGEDGRLWAINPEAGMFGVAPGTSMTTNPNAMRALSHDVIFTNVALRDDGTPWWEGMGEPPGASVTDWRGRRWAPGSPEPAAHPNARFTVAATQCPSTGASMLDPRGVPISAILFGGRRAEMAPLALEARDWRHGVYLGATMVSETTAAATGQVGVARRDPMAMLPFCGYNMGDYFRHWLGMGRVLKKPPRIYQVNWFRVGADGKYLWPGFGDNIRVLDWILRRVEGCGEGRETPLGFVPSERALDLRGLDLSGDRLARLLAVDPGAWIQEATSSRDFLRTFGDRLPEGLLRQHRALAKRLAVGVS
jgi:phosphoenolpyruvate carboxykinase (GTP)